MINIFKRVPTGNYYLRFRPSVSARPLFGGRSDIWKSTGTSDKREATRVAMRLLIALEGVTDVANRLPNVTLPAISVAPLAPLVGVSVSQIQPIFELTSLKRKASTSTEDSRNRECRRLVTWMDNHHHQTLTKEIAYEYVQHLQQGVSIATAKHRLSFVTFPFDVAFKTGRSDPQTAIPFNPFGGLGLVTESGDGKQMREAITPKECRLILANLPSVQKKPALHWVVKLSAVTGLRVNAVTQLLAEDVDKLAGVVCIQVSAKEGNKTELPYWVPIHTIFADDFYKWFLSKQLDKHQRVFNKSTSTISSTFSNLLSRLDIKPADPAKLKSFHSFRHSTATWLKEVMPVESHRNAMQGRQESGSVKAYGSLAGILSYAGSIINAPLWWEDDYLERLHPNVKESS